MAKQEPIPPQEEGAYNDTTEKLTLNSPEEAFEHFQTVKARLLDVSNWHTLCGMTTSRFQLTDPQGKRINRLPKKNDYLKIAIPGPGPKAGSGYDWVQIETIEHEKEKGREWVAIKVRPADNPTTADAEAAHFFNADATSTFMVVKDGNTVSAEVHSRNELPNIRQTGIIDTIRNTFVAIGAILGFSKIQWTQLVKGLIEKKD